MELLKGNITNALFAYKSVYILYPVALLSLAMSVLFLGAKNLDEVHMLNMDSLFVIKLCVHVTLPLSSAISTQYK